MANSKETLSLGIDIISMNYKVKVNNTFDFEITEEEIRGLDIHKTSKNKSHFLHQHKSVEAEIIKADFLQKKYLVKINSNIHEVQIADELDLLIEKMGLSLGNTQAENDIKAPMPGLILDVNVKEGDEVKEGDFLLVLEAMKMENALSAPRDGKVKSVSVKKGDKVDKNQLLVEME